MSITRDLIEGAALVSPIAIGVGLLLLVRTPANADQHDLSDYLTAPAADRPDPGPVLRLRVPTTPTTTAPALTALDVPLSQLDLGVEAPIWEELAARQILRELGEQARARLAVAR